MGYDLRFPMITGATEKEQLTQIKSYLHQLVEQLQWSLNNIDTIQIQYIKSPTKSESSKKADEKGTQATFDALKPLIIKSAEIVEAYYEEINTRLEGEYISQSDFGTFSEQTVQDISANSMAIEQFFTNIQEIFTDIESINFTLSEVNAHIKSGLLYYDENEIPIYGLEIGQKNIIDGVEVFNKYARFTSDRLSFYDHNGIEVAYISDYKLYITHLEILGSIKGGGFYLDLSRGLTLRHVGRS